MIDIIRVQYNHFNCSYTFSYIYSEFSLIRHNLFSKNMVDNWIYIGTCTLYWYWEIVADKVMVD